MSTTGDCEALVSQIEERLRTTTDWLAEINAELTHLKEQGVYDAIPSMSWEARNGGRKKYLRLVFPTEHGRRRREYIGSHPEKIEAAKETIARTKRATKLEAERRRITNHAHRAWTQLRLALSALQGKTRW